MMADALRDRLDDCKCTIDEVYACGCYRSILKKGWDNPLAWCNRLHFHVHRTFCDRCICTCEDINVYTGCLEAHPHEHVTRPEERSRCPDKQLAHHHPENLGKPCSRIRRETETHERRYCPSCPPCECNIAAFWSGCRNPKAHRELVPATHWTTQRKDGGYKCTIRDDISMLPVIWKGPCPECDPPRRSPRAAAPETRTSAHNHSTRGQGLSTTAASRHHPRPAHVPQSLPTRPRPRVSFATDIPPTPHRPREDPSGRRHHHCSQPSSNSSSSKPRSSDARKPKKQDD